MFVIVASGLLGAKMSHSTRIRSLQEKIRNRGLAGAILSYSRDVYYYCGTAQPANRVILPDDYMLFVRRGYEIARLESGCEIDRIVRGASLELLAERMFPGEGWGEKVGTEMDVLTMLHARSINQALGMRELVDISGEILEQRAVKDDEELESVKKACAAVQAGHIAAMSCLRPGISELELSAAVENAQRLAGHEGCFFIRVPDFVMSRGPLASGPVLRKTSGTLFTLSGAGLSSAIPTGASQRIIEDGDLVMVDIPACIEGYHADQSRTYAVGHARSRALDLFQRLRQVADHVIGRLRPGMACGEVFSLAATKARELDLADSFMNFESGTKAHFVGHGIGLELNEPPLLARKSTAVLKAGMVLALEIHVMEPEGLALKLEDSVLISPNGAAILTSSPRELAVV
jgi:Xaa-Pro dipeptidase